MKKLLYQFSLFMLASCYSSGVTQMKIVDSNGKPARISKIVPKFNEEQLNKQKEAFSNSNRNTQINKFKNDYDLVSTNKINTLSNENINISPSPKNYPNDIFADRITNYDYIVEEQKNQTLNIIIPETNKISKKAIEDGIILDNKKEVFNKTKENLENNINKKNVTEIISIEKNDKNIIYNTDKFKNSNKNNDNVDNTKEIKSNNTKNININKISSNIKVDNKSYYIQIGIYQNIENANNVSRKYSSIGNTLIENHNINGIKKYKVLLGPYVNKQKADQDLKKVIKTGHYDVYITETK